MEFPVFGRRIEIPDRALAFIRLITVCLLSLPLITSCDSGSENINRMRQAELATPVPSAQISADIQPESPVPTTPVYTAESDEPIEGSVPPLFETLDMALLLGTYDSVSDPDCTLELKLEPNCLFARLVYYRTSAFEEYIDIPQTNPFVVFSGWQPYSLHYDASTDSIYVNSDDESFNGWYEKTASVSPEDAIPYAGQTDLKQYEGVWSSMSTDDVDIISFMLQTNDGANPVQYAIEYMPGNGSTEQVSFSGKGIIENNALNFQGIDSNGNHVSGGVTFKSRADQTPDVATIHSEVYFEGPPTSGIPMIFSTTEIGSLASTRMVGW